MNRHIAFVGFLLLTAVAGAQEPTAPPNGTIYGTAFDSDGHPASQIVLEAMPLGVALGQPFRRLKQTKRASIDSSVFPGGGDIRYSQMTKTLATLGLVLASPVRLSPKRWKYPRITAKDCSLYTCHPRLVSCV
jgi:hypothetical protein